MKKTLFLTIFISLSFGIFAQTPAKYWVQFTDKNNSKFSVAKPEEFLSPRAIEKRQRFNIAVTETDLPVNESYITQVLALDTSIVLYSKSKWHNGITIYCTNDSIFSLLKALNFVKFAERTIKLKENESRYKSVFYKSFGNNFATPSNTKPTKDLDYGKSKEQIYINNAQWLHRLGFRGEGIQMMVLDGGFHNTDSIRHFKNLRNDGRILGIRNFVQPAIDPMRKSERHGTMVLSCIASEVSGELIGTAPKISVFLSETEDGRSENKVEEDNWVAAIEFADSLGCDVINSSLGYTRYDDDEKSYNSLLLNGKTSRASLAAAMAAERGIICCISAGNAGNDAWKYIGTPADAYDVLAAGGIDIYKKRSVFTSYNTPENAAINRVKPDACTVATNVWLANPFSKTTTANGTSFASPLLAGMVSCLWQAFPQKSAYEVMQAVRLSGSQADKPNESLGYGIADMLKAYNLLLNPQNDDFQVKLNNVVLNKKPFVFAVNSNISQNIEIIIEQENAKFRIQKNFKIKKGKNILKIKELSKISTNLPFDFVNLKIKSDVVEEHFVLGIEHN
ncbi:MAG: S8 family serine peptidase [Prevotellaceae bacterium]|jgi:hypothetical protein|nr:S8 family serine peptidase [Prevotellaceae bacterium]